KLLLADFGLSNSLESKEGYTSEFRRAQAYVDPKLLRRKPNHRHEKSSDIYSFGVLMWEIYTRRIPFAKSDHDDLFSLELFFGLRMRNWNVYGLYKNI
ncbi:3302_t:CDS:1, partial [Dentiscutata erythropus]